MGTKNYVLLTAVSAPKNQVSLPQAVRNEAIQSQVQNRALTENQSLTNTTKGESREPQVPLGPGFIRIRPEDPYAPSAQERLPSTRSGEIKIPSTSAEIQKTKPKLIKIKFIYKTEEPEEL